MHAHAHVHLCACAHARGTGEGSAHQELGCRRGDEPPGVRPRRPGTSSAPCSTRSCDARQSKPRGRSKVSGWRSREARAGRASKGAIAFGLERSFGTKGWSELLISSRQSCCGLPTLPALIAEPGTVTRGACRCGVCSSCCIACGVCGWFSTPTTPGGAAERVPPYCTPCGVLGGHMLRAASWIESNCGAGQSITHVAEAS